MTDEILRELIEFIENASPAVWSTLLKQVYSDAFTLLAWGVFVAILAVVSFKLARVFNKKNKDGYNGRDDYEFMLWMTSVLAVVAVPSAFAMFVEAIKYLINPEFYAIRFILMQIGGGG
jgi:hypothetical protein